MAWLLSKYLITAGLVVLISEIAKRSEKFGALMTALPLVAILTLMWLYFEQQPTEKIASYAQHTFWYVLPTLPMFLLFPWLLQRYGFWTAMGVSVPVTLVSFALLAMIMKRFGIILL